MKSKVKKKWVAALRSGNYQQGSGKLRTSEDLYCCLGVLCEIAVQEGIIPAAKRTTTGHSYKYGDGTDPNTAFLPDSVSNWAALTGKGEEPLFDWSKSLIAFNDEGASFSEIADLIEKYL